MPELTPDEVAAIIAALRSGNAIVCLTKCWSCQFGECPPVSPPHTWMSEADLVHAQMPVPACPAEWIELAVRKPCGCSCNQGRQ
jgi:hypothetical protein